eukprot:CAMPEP_0170168638 /NCGR_PEP_ID=MMETSP0040_2-20121228/1596_1 /TAXON_ID=641309 /ORGANISM="Lotharella oceanica, Strain CCMP622" /LENGTH=328 /DNA_ID=CAMNT_0010406925 /DNA_START=246 /DNA_END=1232 /DNA_ORIENTATION=+
MERRFSKGIVEEKDTSKVIRKFKELHKYAVLNYLAVLKIAKKHDKHFPNLRHSILESLMSTALYEAVNTPKLFEGCAKLISPSDRPECPICLETSVVPVTLACGHEFCWPCLWKGDMEKLFRCPLCRKSQTLNPSEMNIIDVLGGVADKYFPKRIESNIEDNDDGQMVSPVSDEDGSSSEDGGIDKPVTAKKSVDELQFVKIKLNKGAKDSSAPEVSSSSAAFEPLANRLVPSSKKQETLPSTSTRDTKIRMTVRTFDETVGSISHLRKGVHNDLVQGNQGTGIEIRERGKIVTFGNAPVEGVSSATSSSAPERKFSDDDGCMFRLDM